jgi:hypothetical protein
LAQCGHPVQRRYFMSRSGVNVLNTFLSIVADFLRKIAFFLKTKKLPIFLLSMAVILVKLANFLADIFCLLKIIAVC